MKKFLFSILTLFVCIVAYGQQVVADTDVKYIASASQISSPYTEPTEGSIEALIDGDPNTFWHSTWTGGNVSAGTHYFEVNVANLPEKFAITFSRRPSDNDHITLWGIYGAPSSGATKQDCTLLATWETPFTSNTETLVSPVYESQGFTRLRFYCENTVTNTSETKGFFHLSEFQILGTKEILIKGDMNNDGQVSISDVTSVVNVILGKSPVETITLSTSGNNSGDSGGNSSPYAVDNSMVVGTWYAPDGTRLTLNEDGSTDYANNSTYKFMPLLGRILFYGTNGEATTVVGVAEITEDYMLILDYTTGVLTYYTKSSSLSQVTGVTLSQTSLAMNSGTTQQLSVTVSPSSAFNQTVTWSSSDVNVATVDQNGLVSAVAGGSCTITATSTDGSGVSASCTVSVTQMVTNIVLSPRTLFLQLDEFVRLTATVLPETAANKNVVWSSSNENVATVRSGRVDAFGYGSAVITCAAADGSGVYAKCMVYVIQSEDELYVDLGLPSGTLWATMNVGATSPEDYGDYFAWGETEGYYSGKILFDWSTYKWCKGSDTTFTKYCTYSNYGYNGFADNKTELDPEDDAAYVNWGSAWRMPSYDQCRELLNSSYTTTEWTTVNGVNGRKITSKTNGNSIFLPAAGYRNDSELYLPSSGGYYWGRRDNQIYQTTATILGVGSESGGLAATIFRCRGLSIRPIRVSE